jgi:hydrogenase expression/formation protein HypD
MKYIDEYRNPGLATALLDRIRSAADGLDRPATIMEVCGSHTMAIGRYGIRGLLPENVRLISGPGCPVCVTSVRDIDTALYLAGCEGVIFATFGDMIRVPGSRGATLQKARAAGADVRVIASGQEVIRIAETNRDKHVVFMGIGFETTSPVIAAVIRAGKQKGIDNLSILSAHKTIPPAMRVLIADPDLNIDGFLCPGHVSIIIGADAYGFIAGAGRASVITGFEPVDILEGILMVIRQIREKAPRVEIQYARAVRPQGNERARAMLAEVFDTADAEWRGLGTIPESGLVLKKENDRFNALCRFNIPEMKSSDVSKCRCGDILRGIISPPDCPLYKVHCQPQNPIGPCMVSSEGTCAAYFKYA